MNVYRTIRTLGLKLVRIILSLLIPVNRNRIIFQSSPDYSDNARAFSDYLLNNTNYSLIWAVSDISGYNNTNRIKFIRSNSNRLFEKLVYIYYTVSSKYLFSTHSAFLFANKRKQIYTCLWHGMPLKRIALLQSEDNRNYLNNASFIISTSKYYVPILAKCFGKENQEILPLGYPRNDWLYEETDVLAKLGINLAAGEKLILYLPTFRTTNNGNYVDTNTDMFKSDVVDIRTDIGIKMLNSFLNSINVFLIIKPHPAETNQTQLQRHSNLLIIPHSYFTGNDIQLNQVMHYSHGLITDFSGAYCDFLNLNRPIGFVLFDIKEYSNSRGFVFDNITQYLAGEKIYTYSDFKLFCKNVAIGKDDYAQERDKVSKYFNDYSDNKNCQRLAQYIGLVN